MIVIAVVLIVVAAIVTAGALIGGGGSATVDVLNLAVTTSSTGFFLIGAGAAVIFLIGVALLTGGLRRGRRRRREVRELRERAERAERREEAALPPDVDRSPASEPRRQEEVPDAGGATREAGGADDGYRAERPSQPSERPGAVDTERPAGDHAR